MLTENFKLSQALRQSVLSTAIRIAGADVGVDFDVSEAKFELPPNIVLLRGNLIVLTPDGGTTPTLSLGIEGTLGAYGANLAAGVAAAVPLTGMPVKIVEASTIVITAGTGTIAGDGDYLLALEYIVEGRWTETYG